MSTVGRSGVGIGQLLLRINQFNECQAKRPATSSENHMQFWREFVDEFFFNRATYKYIVWLTDHDTRSFQLFQLGIETLPRFYNVIYSSSISSVYYILENPREYCLDSKTYLLFSPKTRVEYKYDNGCRVITKGFLRVTFSEELKIILWEFEAKCHEEYFPTSIFRDKRMKQQQRTSLNLNASDTTPNNNNNNNTGGVISLDALPNSQVNQFGLPPPVMRCFEITEVINYMKDLIDFALERQLAPHESLELYHKEMIDKADTHSLQSHDQMNEDIDHLSGFDELKHSDKKENSPQKKPDETDSNALHSEEKGNDQIQIKDEPKEKQEKEDKKTSQNEKAESDEDSDKTPKRSRSQNTLFPAPLNHKSKRKKK